MTKPKTTTTIHLNFEADATQIAIIEGIYYLHAMKEAGPAPIVCTLASYATQAEAEQAQTAVSKSDSIETDGVAIYDFTYKQLSFRKLETPPCSAPSDK
jgi:hypothetical protein